MLDRAKLMREFGASSKKLFLDLSDEYEQAARAWQACVADTLCLQKVQAYPSYNLVTWQGTLADVVEVPRWTEPYYVVSVDGSQIYPDKHQGTSCFLLNIGTVVMRYGLGQGASHFSSEPFLFVEHDIDDETARSVDVVNGKREEFELQRGIEVCGALQDEQPDMPLLFLFDGSLIFWHLESKETALKNYFLQSYCQVLEQFYKRNIPIVGYISLPKSKDLVNLVRAHMTDFTATASERTKKIPHLVDTSISRFFLEPGQRSTLFQSHVPIAAHYPAAVRPWFCYYATPHETVRLEFPQYVVQNAALLECSFSMIADQVLKGNGYPVSTAEAHVQAVVKGPDREFFYHAVEKHGIDQKRQILLSQKNLKKRKMSI